MSNWSVRYDIAATLRSAHRSTSRQISAVYHRHIGRRPPDAATQRQLRRYDKRNHGGINISTAQQRCSSCTASSVVRHSKNARRACDRRRDGRVESSSRNDDRTLLDPFSRQFVSVRAFRLASRRRQNSSYRRRSINCHYANGARHHLIGGERRMSSTDGDRTSGRRYSSSCELRRIHLIMCAHRSSTRGNETRNNGRRKGRSIYKVNDPRLDAMRRGARKSSHGP